jgi:hypothetical protein
MISFVPSQVGVGDAWPSSSCHSQTRLASVQQPLLICQEPVGISICKFFSNSGMIDSVEVSQGRFHTDFLLVRDLSAAYGLQSLQSGEACSFQ